MSKRELPPLHAVFMLSELDIISCHLYEKNMLSENESKELLKTYDLKKKFIKICALINCRTLTFEMLTKSATKDV